LLEKKARRILACEKKILQKKGNVRSIITQITQLRDKKLVQYS